MNIEIWEEDKLNRKKEAEYLIQYLNSVYKESEKSSFVLNINSEWGFGKTYFLKNLKLELENRKHKVMYFDAWQNDFTKEPLLAFIAEANNSFESFFNNQQKKSKQLIKSLFSSSLPILVSILSKKLTGYTIDELQEEINEDEESSIEESGENSEIPNTVSSIMTKATEVALREHNTAKESILVFKQNMEKLVNYMDNLSTIELPIYILIDELDRCRPNYAIELLESIKHLFDVKGLIFIIATDSKQLTHSINAIYGSGFHSEKYLKRFFDREYSLAKPSHYDFIEYVMTKNNLLNSEKIYSALDDHAYRDVNKDVRLIQMYAEFFNLGLRDIEQCIITLKSIEYIWDNENKLHIGYIMFLLMLKHKNSDEFEKYVKLDKKRIRVIDFINEVNLDIVNKKIKVNFGNDESSLAQLVQEYTKLELLTYEDLGNQRNISYIKKDIGKGLNNVSRHNFDDQKIVYPEFGDYYKYVIHGKRFN